MDRKKGDKVYLSQSSHLFRSIVCVCGVSIPNYRFSFKGDLFVVEIEEAKLRRMRGVGKVIAAEAKRPSVKREPNITSPHERELERKNDRITFEKS